MRKYQHGHWRKGAIAITVLTLLVVAGLFAGDFFKRMGPPERCWEIREIDGRLYKANPCTGKFILLGDAPGPAKDR